MLEGDLAVEGQVLHTGDYCAAIAGTIHASTYSQDSWVHPPGVCVTGSAGVSDQGYPLGRSGNHPPPQ